MGNMHKNERCRCTCGSHYHYRITNKILKEKEKIYIYYILFVGKEGVQDNTDLIKNIEEGYYIDNAKKYYKEHIMPPNNI